LRSSSRIEIRAKGRGNAILGGFHDHWRASRLGKTPTGEVGGPAGGPTRIDNSATRRGNAILTA